MVTTDADHEEVKNMKNITLPRNVVQEVEEMITGEMICMSQGEEVAFTMSMTSMKMSWEEETLGLLDNHEFLTTHMHQAVMEIEK